MPLFKNTRQWFYTLLKTAIGGLAGGVITSVGARVAMPNNIIDFSDMWKLAIVSGISTAGFNLFFYLKDSPLPPEGDETEHYAKPPEPPATDARP